MKKIIASLLAALMLAMPVAPALAKTFGEFPTFLGIDGTADYYIVVGTGGEDPKGLASDIAGAIDIATRLAELSYTTVTVTGAGAAITGVEKELDLYDNITDQFPNPLKYIHYEKLKDSTISWKGEDYDFHEEVYLGTSGQIQFRHAFSESNINGTEKLVIPQDALIYRYVFDEGISLNGSLTSPNYEYPVEIELLGEKFLIVGVGSNSIKVLKGSVGTATATTPVTYGDYSIYSDLGANNQWARIIIKDSAGNTVDTLIIDKGYSKDSTVADLTIKVTAVRALTDGTVVGTDVVVGPRGKVDKTYDSSIDTAIDQFSGDWYIRTKSGTFGSTTGNIEEGDTIEVVYHPTTTQYLKAGEKITAPNNYFEFGFEGWNTDKFVTVTVKPVTGITAYNASAETQAYTDLNGLEISADVSGSLMIGTTGYTKVYLLFNKTYGTSPNVMAPVMLAYYDQSKQKILVEDSNLHVLNQSDGETYTFSTLKISYGGAGEVEIPFSITIDSDGPSYISTFRVGGATTGVIADFENKTANSWTSTKVPEFRLGTSDTAVATDIKAYTEGSISEIGLASQDVVADAGIIVVNPTGNAGSQMLQVKAPAKALKVKAYFGEMGAAATETGEYKVIKPITSSVALLDTEVTATHKAKNIITVGGPCVNRITAEALGLDYPACGAASTIPENAAMIKIIDDVFTTGKSVVVVAGWSAENTRTACTVLQNYDTLLTHVADQSAVKVTAATQTGITAL